MAGFPVGLLLGLMFLGCALVASCQDTDTKSAEAEEEMAAESESEFGLSEDSNNTKGTPSVAILARKYTYFKVGMALQRYYIPILVPIGFIGNVLSLMVMFRKHNRRVSCCVYMIALAFSDIMMLFTAAYLWAIPEIAPPDRDWDLYECKFVCYSFGTFGLAGVYLIMFMTFDRWVAVVYPFKASRWCTVRRARITCIVVVVGSAVYEIPHFIYAGVILGKQCAPFTYSDSAVVGYTMLNIVINAFLPFTLIFIMNFMIIATILRRQDAFKHSSAVESKGDSGMQQKDERAAQQTRQLVVMLLLISFALVFLTLPQYLRYVIWRFVNQQTSPAHFATYVLFFHISNKMFFTNNAINFFMYCAGGSKFRADLKVILSCGMYKPQGTASSSGSEGSKVTGVSAVSSRGT